MRAFHNDAKIKEKYLKRVIAHGKADEIIKDQYWEGGKGCAVGCTIHSSQHKAYETKLGIPQVLAKLEDKIFEGLPNKEAMLWPKKFLAAIKPGADLSKVWPKFAIWLLTDKVHGILQYAKKEQQKVAIKTVSNLYKRSLKEEITKQEWEDADAYASAYAAAYAAAAAAAYAAARQNAYVHQSKKLLSLLKACK